ncbi:MAG: SsrA-binding protein SmpB [Planctomycetota bacterium]|nr:SsrA-binding protein SmpB [Planctomycetota bacterium]
MAGKKGPPSAEHVICRNRRARHEYEIFDTFEAGLVLVGSEVKSLRNGKVSLDDSFGRVLSGEVWLLGADIATYREANTQNHEPKRQRKLLLHKREIKKLIGKVKERGLTLVPLRLYFRRGLAKVEMALARGKKIHDKRRSIKEKTAQREMRRALNLS